MNVEIEIRLPHSFLSFANLMKYKWITDHCSHYVFLLLFRRERNAWYIGITTK